MPSTFLGLEIGRRGLAAAQVGQEVTGHNIANAGTPGYSAQRLDQVAADPLTVVNGGGRGTVGQLGTGVIARTITRARDQFLDAQARDGLSGQNAQLAQRDALHQVEIAFGEPSDTGLNHTLNRFFQNFNELANNPEDLGIRATVIGGGDALARVFRGVQQRLDVTGAQVSSKISADVATLNDYGKQIAALNVTIRQAVAQNQTPNDLLDRRDLLLDKLAGLANISVVAKTDGGVDVAVGTSELVGGVDATTLTVSGLTARGDLQGGELAGLTQAQSDLAGYQSDLDTLASQTIAQVNTLHSTGVGLDGTTGLAFFTGTDARTIGVNGTLASSPQKLAAAALPLPVAPGDARNAQKLAALQNAVQGGGPLAGNTLPGFLQQRLSDLGAKSAAAQTGADSATASAEQLGRQRDSVSGVTTDTELVSMLKYQRAYEASARVVRTMDEMIGTLINDLFAR